MRVPARNRYISDKVLDRHRSVHCVSDFVEHKEGENSTSMPVQPSDHISPYVVGCEYSSGFRMYSGGIHWAL